MYTFNIFLGGGYKDIRVLNVSWWINFLIYAVLVLLNDIQ